MDQARPYMRDSVKSLEKVFTDYAFNKKVLTAVYAELGLRTTKSAVALRIKVKQRLEEIAKRDRFGREKPVKVTPPVAPPPAQLPLIEKTVVKPVRVARPSTPPPAPHPQPIIISNPPKVTAPPQPAKQDTQGKVRAKANIPLLIVIFTVIAFLFLWWWKLNTTTGLKRQNQPVTAEEAKVISDDIKRAHDKELEKIFEDHSGGPAAQRSNEGGTLTYEEIMRIKDKELDKIFGSSPPPNARHPEAAKPTDPTSMKERLDGYRDTVDALLH